MTRGKSLKIRIMDWIDEIPDSKLDGCYAEGAPAYMDRYCRLDCQGVTTGEPKHFNMQVQVNSGCPDTTMRLLKPKTVAFALIPINGGFTAQQTKDALKATVTGNKVDPPKIAKGGGNKPKGKR